MKYRCLDLFCGQGGVSYGLTKAGFDVTGVDLYPMPKYPYRFVQADALEFDLHGYDFIWASPVCKKYSSATKTAGTQDLHPDQIPAIRERLAASGVPYIIENVTTAPLIAPVMLCGAMFGLKTYRHRIFESNVPLRVPQHQPHTAKVAKMGRRPKNGEFINPVGHFSDVQAGRDALGIQWMGQDGLSQAIPPAYAEYLGLQIIEYLNSQPHAPHYNL
jgi:DNA (cytosine-5)-methyltransferase 1